VLNETKPTYRRPYATCTSWLRTHILHHFLLLRLNPLGQRTLPIVISLSRMLCFDRVCVSACALNVSAALQGAYTGATTAWCKRRIKIPLKALLTKRFVRGLLIRSAEREREREFEPHSLHITRTALLRWTNLTNACTNELAVNECATLVCTASAAMQVSLCMASPYIYKLRTEIIYARACERPCAGSDPTHGEGCHHLATCASFVEATLPAVLQIMLYGRVATNYPKRLSRCC